MKILPEKARPIISGFLMMLTMVIMMPGLGLYIQKDMLPPNTDINSMWLENVMAIAPYAIPIAIILSIIFNIIIGIFTKKPEMA